ncbi:dihydrodipicolinate synthase family protein [Propionibacterium freudenreichii]|uniref:dihydrodipicolinate synthase family protein n=1 Tax=Propionibacterium freudenreichii TaxID=1744 RepID=UPI00254B2496|nr:dihydrodipicolinate synthase family protein [Propionibacterium freudenreichii]MDK9296119.1 dihydrodipicolinate synthase family protein [Propionibacterium freudenreichii]MDK9361513.1 dihydrodipicolinate synthase family protein [Propionibacterium freudenreichii]
MVTIDGAAGQQGFRGIIPYLPTPLTRGGDIDDRATRLLIDRLIDAGVDGISPLGFTGEAQYLDDAHKGRLLGIVVDQVEGRVPVIPGVLAPSTDRAVQQCRAAEQGGADGLVAMCQTWGPVEPEQLFDHFASMAGATELPVTLYRQPALGALVDVATITRLAQLPTVRSLKDASTDTGFLLQVQCAVGDRLDLFAASAHVPLLVWEMGGVGWMAGPACVVPNTAAALFAVFGAGDRQRVWQLQRAIWPLCRFFTAHGPAVVVKAALALRGLDVGAAMAPQRRLEASDRAQLGQILADIARARAALDLDPQLL